MPIERFFIHDLVLRRATPGDPDRTGHVEPAFLPENEVSFRGNVQDRRGREVVNETLGGQVVVDTVIFAPVMAMVEGDQIAYGDDAYDIRWVKDPAGAAHDLEVGATLIRSGQASP